jgi:hypothetical protein
MFECVVQKENIIIIDKEISYIERHRDKKKYKRIVLVGYFQFLFKMSIESFDQIESTCPNQDYKQVVSILIRKKK